MCFRNAIPLSPYHMIIQLTVSPAVFIEIDKLSLLASVTVDVFTDLQRLIISKF